MLLPESDVSPVAGFHGRSIFLLLILVLVVHPLSGCSDDNDSVQDSSSSSDTTAHSVPGMTQRERSSSPDPNAAQSPNEAEEVSDNRAPFSEEYRLREAMKHQAQADLREMGYELTNADFYNAVYTGEAVAVEFFLLAGARMDLPDDTKQLPLHVAAIHGYDDIVEIMISHDADPNIRSGIAGQTPLQLAAFHGSVESADHLLRAGANPNGQNDEGDTPIQVAALRGHENLVRLLLSYGAEPDLTNDTGHTALHAAAVAGDPSIYRLLMDAGANPEARNTDGLTPEDLRAQASR